MTLYTHRAGREARAMQTSFPSLSASAFSAAVPFPTNAAMRTSAAGITPHSPLRDGSGTANCTRSNEIQPTVQNTRNQDLQYRSAERARGGG
jgi:hypothetical protein